MSGPAKRLQQISDQLISPCAVDTYRHPRSSKDVPHFTPLNPIRFLMRAAVVYAQKTAIIYNGHSYTFEQLADRARRLANALLESYEIEKGDRVGILCLNHPVYIEAHYAVPATGGIMVPINTRLSADEIEYIIDHSGTKVLLVDEETVQLLTEKARKQVKTIVISDHPEKNEYERVLSNSSNKLLWRELYMEQNELAVISINYTSGSTARPKGVQALYRGCYLAGVTVAGQLGISSESVLLSSSPMFHCNGWNFPYGVVGVGGTQIIMGKVDYARIWRYLKESNVTHYNGAPVVQNLLCHHPDAVRLPHPVKGFSGGSPLPKSVFKRLRELNIFITQIYGLTETYGPSVVSYDYSTLSHIDEEQQFDLLARQGHPCNFVDEIRVISQETGKDVALNSTEVGEICFSGNLVSGGYYRNEEATKNAYRDGLFWTGDLAVRHPDGAIEVVDRSKDMILSGAENISSLEVEATVLKMDNIMECAVVSMPDDKWGERPAAFIVLEKGKTLNEEQIISHCRANLAGYKCPSKIFFADELPKTSTGKTKKVILREKLWIGRGKKIQ